MNAKEELNTYLALKESSMNLLNTQINKSNKVYQIQSIQK